MSTTNSTTVLSPGDAIALGDLLGAITRKERVRWMDATGVIREGELRSLVKGENDFGFAPFGTDVRDMWVWVTAGIGEATFSVTHAIKCLHEGGMVFTPRS
jgi:hypothetical protein